jgi:hypothetical protein
VYAITLESLLEAFLLAFVSASAIAAVTALITLLRYLRRMDRTLRGVAHRQSHVVRWAKHVGRILGVRFPLDSDHDLSPWDDTDPDDDVNGT